MQLGSAPTLSLVFLSPPPTLFLPALARGQLTPRSFAMSGYWSASELSPAFLVNLLLHTAFFPHGQLHSANAGVPAHGVLPHPPCHKARLSPSDYDGLMDHSPSLSIQLVPCLSSPSCAAVERHADMSAFRSAVTFLGPHLVRRFTRIMATLVLPFVRVLSLCFSIVFFLLAERYRPFRCLVHDFPVCLVL